MPEQYCHEWGCPLHCIWVEQYTLQLSAVQVIGTTSMVMVPTVSIPYCMCCTYFTTLWWANQTSLCCILCLPWVTLSHLSHLGHLLGVLSVSSVPIWGFSRDLSVFFLWWSALRSISALYLSSISLLWGLLSFDSLHCTQFCVWCVEICLHSNSMLLLFHFVTITTIICCTFWCLSSNHNHLPPSVNILAQHPCCVSIKVLLRIGSDPMNAKLKVIS